METIKESANYPGVPTLEGLNNLFANVITIALSLAGVVLFIMLLSGGISFITSGGDPKKTETAKGTLTSAIVGMIILVLSYLILQLVGKLTGTTLTTFNIIGK